MVSLGIDFGTSTTVAAVYRDGRARVLRNGKGKEVTPSCVAYPPNGETVFGNAAKRRRAIDPKNSIYSMKRILGHAWVRSEVREFTRSYPFELEPGDDEMPRFVTRAGKLSATEVVASLLQHVRQWPDLEATEVGNVSLSVPTAFGRGQRDSLKAAAEAAGFSRTEVIDEPCAAALAHLEGNDNELVLGIYDLGGGTFDLTVLRWTGADYQVLGVGGDSYADYEILGIGGDPYLGGDDVDLKCANWVMDQVLRTHRWDIRASDASFQRLLFACETAKQLLSLADEHTIDLTGIDEVLRNESVALSRGQLQNLCRDLVRRTFIICDDVLSQAGVQARDIDGVVLSGGGCHMPIIQQGVGQYFGHEPIQVVEPDRAVALGAALHAGRSALEEK